MIATVTKGRGARGLLDYLTADRDSNGKVRPHVVDLGGTLAGRDVREMATAMGALQAERPTVTRYVFHAMLSWDAAGGDAPDLATQADMMRDHMHALGFEDFRAFSHGDHVHGIASRILPGGKVVSESDDWRRAEASCRSLEIKYGLRQIASSPNLERGDPSNPVATGLTRGELGMARREIRDAERQDREPRSDYEAMPTKPVLADAVLAARELAIKNGGSMSAFIDACHLAGVEVRLNWSAESGRVSGLSFFLTDAPDVEVSASKISRSLSWANLLKGGLSYEFSRDGESFREAAKRATSIRPDGKAGRVENPGVADGERPGRSIPPAGVHDGGLATGRGQQPGADGGLAGSAGIRVEPLGGQDDRAARPDAGGQPGDSRGAGGTHGEAGGGAERGGPESSGPGAGHIGRGDSGNADRSHDADECGPPDDSELAEGGGSGADRDGQHAAGEPPKVADASTDSDWVGPSYERVRALGGVTDARLARTMEAVSGTVAALGEASFVVGILPPRGTPPEVAVSLQTMHKTVSAKSLVGVGMVKYLRLMNARGHDIYIKPAGAEDGKRPPLVLVDDLAPSGVEAMKRDGVEPCLVVTTSRPDNVQAWVRVGRIPLPVDTLRQIARDLAERYGGDPLAAKGEQFGRLPGFTNRKPVRIAENGGQPPYACVIEAISRVARAAVALVTGATARVRQAEADREAAQQAQIRAAAARSAELAQEAVTDSVARHWRAASVRSGGDLSRADFAAACGALRDGHDPDAVRDALASITPDLATRHARPDDYLARTVSKANDAVQVDAPRTYGR